MYTHTHTHTHTHTAATTTSLTTRILSANRCPHLQVGDRYLCVGSTLDVGLSPYGAAAFCVTRSAAPLIPVSTHFCVSRIGPSDYLQQATCVTWGVMLNFDAAQFLPQNTQKLRFPYEVALTLQRWSLRRRCRPSFPGPGRGSLPRLEAQLSPGRIRPDAPQPVRANTRGRVTQLECELPSA